MTNQNSLARPFRSGIWKESLTSWLLNGSGSSSSNIEPKHEQKHWWQVMCLTGVDYFSTLGYQPSIAVIAAGSLAPLATLILVFVTLFFALPIYRRVAQKSPYGQGSISMLEGLLKGWRGKSLVLCLLGFAATDFIITMTLSAADAAAHIVENPVLHDTFAGHNVAVTNVLLIFLGAIFLKGFREVIAVSIVLVGSYLLMTGAVIAVSLKELAIHPELFSNWSSSLIVTHHDLSTMLLLSFLVFPKLALGLSGFETGVGVMPLVKGNGDDTAENPLGRIANTRKMLSLAAGIMAVYLIGSSLVTTVLVPAEAIVPGGEADGRALSYLGHHLLGTAFGSTLDVFTVLILWFAGASALAGLINMVPRYLPRFGMAPEWAKAGRPLTIFFTLTALAVTALFDADVNLQSGAYATGVLVLITSASVAVTMSLWQDGWSRRLFFVFGSLVFAYTTLANVVERPDGLKVATFFIVTIFVTSLTSRVLRAKELRIGQVALDATAQSIVKEAMAAGSLRFIANKPGNNGYSHKRTAMCEAHSLENPDDLIFLEITVLDASTFHSDVLQVKGTQEGTLKILKCESHAVPNAIARLLLHLRDQTRLRPDAYFGWGEGGPLSDAFRFIFLGEGETGTLTRSIIKQVEPKPERRPRVHVV